MILIDAQVLNYKSIEDSTKVSINKDITILVGQNESGKTAFLQALYKSEPVERDLNFDYISDYPRKDVLQYEERHERVPDLASKFTYELEPDEIENINTDLKYNLLSSLKFSISHNYKNSRIIGLDVSEEKYVQYLIGNSNFNQTTKEQLTEITAIKDLVIQLESLDLNTEETTLLTEIKQKFFTDKENWSFLSYYIYNQFLVPNIPQFLYFDDYKLLPGKINLPTLQKDLASYEQNKDPNNLDGEQKSVLSLLSLANVDLNKIVESHGYEQYKSRLEGLSNLITRKIFDFWNQSSDLEVEFDIREDSSDKAPFNVGNNLYIRIKNRRHNVTVPFDQRSKGFIWFFSFIVTFDRIKKDYGTIKNLILLLDEPGLSLHALAQNDFLKYINNLSEKHQIIYTTHSPFMVPGASLDRVRTVEDIRESGTKISENFSGSDPKTIFPLQAALGYTIAQNLFISTKNLLVEGSADLIYIQYFSSILEELGREYLRNDITITPVGGVDKIATFVALLGANELELVVLHDYEKKYDQIFEGLLKEKIIHKSQILHYGLFRDAQMPTSGYIDTDIEDLFTRSLYLQLFNEAYKCELKGTQITDSDLNTNPRILKAIDKYLKEKNIVLRPSGGYNHYLIANYLATHPISPQHIDPEILDRFEELFKKVNSSFQK